jgi:hypothetical protein
MIPNSKLTNDLCLVSREGVCLLDMQRVIDTAKSLGLSQLAELVEQDLQENKILDGAYYPIVAGVYGVQP